MSGTDAAGRSAAAGIAAAVVGVGALASVVRAVRDPTALGLRPSPGAFAFLLGCGLIGALGALALRPPVRALVARFVAPLAVTGLWGAVRLGLSPWPGFAVALFGFGLLLAWLGWVRGVRAVGWPALVIAVVGALFATLPPASLPGGPPPSANAIGTFGNERRLCRRLAAGVVAREAIEVPFAPFVRIVAAAAPESAGAALELEVRSGAAAWHGRLSLAPPEGGGFVRRTVEIVGIPTGPAVLEWRLDGDGVLSLAEMEIFSAAPPALIERLAPAPTIDPALCEASHGGVCRLVSAAGVARPAAVVWPSTRIPIDAEVGDTLLVPVAVPQPYWTRPVVIELFFGWDDADAVRRTIAAPARPWQVVELAVPVAEEPEQGPVLSVRGGPGPFAVGPPVVRRDRRAARSVVLISLDTVRADRLGAYGHAAARTPHLDALAARGVRFRDATSTSSWTLPAHASLLASRPASDLMSFPRGRTPFATVVPLLTEVLATSGHEAVAFTGGGFMSRYYGFARGFELYAEANDRIDDTTFSLDRVSRWIEERRGGPFFLLFHSFRAHGPYEWAAGDFDARFAALAAAYDDAVAAADLAVGRLLTLLDDAGLLEEALIVVLSDHGEALGERWPEVEGTGHGQGLQQEVARIPLIMTGGSIAPGSEVGATVSLLDLAPTIAAYVGVEAPTGWAGRSLWPAIEGGELEAMPILIEQFERAGVDSRAVRLGSLKVVADAIGADVVAARVYDLDADPGERRPLAVADCPAAEPLLELLAGRFAADRADGAGGDVPADVSERLRALGYLD